MKKEAIFLVIGILACLSCNVYAYRISRAVTYSSNSTCPPGQLHGYLTNYTDSHTIKRHCCCDKILPCADADIKRLCLEEHPCDCRKDPTYCYVVFSSGKPEECHITRDGNWIPNAHTSLAVSTMFVGLTPIVVLLLS